MTIFQQLHQTAPESKGRGNCYYANLKESSLAWKIMLVLSRIELTPSIFEAPNLTRQISILLCSSAKKLLHTIIKNKKKKKKLNQTFSPVWVTFHVALKVEMCLLNWNDYTFFPPMAKTIIVTRNTGSKGKKSCQTEAVWSLLDKKLTNYLNWDWFASKLWQDQLRQTTFAGDLVVWRPHGVPTQSPVATLLLWVHTVDDDLREIVSFSQSAAVWPCQQVQFDLKCFPPSNRLSIVLFTDGGSVTSERSTFWGLGRRTTWWWCTM